MAFALTSSIAYPAAISAPVARQHATQIIVLNCTATTADVALDIGNLGGTFWGAVDATDMGAAVLAQVTLLYPQLAGTWSIESPQLLDRVQVASLTGAGQYTIAENATTLLPEVAVNAADGETVWQIQISCPLLDSQPGMTWAYFST